jgi:hypothetical protein
MLVVVLVFLVGLPLLMLGIAALWDAQHRRQTGAGVTVTRRRRKYADVVVQTSLQGIAVEHKTRAVKRDSNYGDIGPR